MLNIEKVRFSSLTSFQNTTFFMGWSQKLFFIVYDFKIWILGRGRVFFVLFWCLVDKRGKQRKMLLLKARLILSDFLFLRKINKVSKLSLCDFTCVISLVFIQIDSELVNVLPFFKINFEKCDYYKVNSPLVRNFYWLTNYCLVTVL